MTAQSCLSCSGAMPVPILEPGDVHDYCVSGIPLFPLASEAKIPPKQSTEKMRNAIVMLSRKAE